MEEHALGHGIPKTITMVLVVRLHFCHLEITLHLKMSATLSKETSGNLLSTLQSLNPTLPNLQTIFCLYEKKAYVIFVSTIKFKDEMLGITIDTIGYSAIHWCPVAYFFNCGMELFPPMTCLAKVRKFLLQRNSWIPLISLLRGRT